MTELKIIHRKTDAGAYLVGHRVVKQAVSGKGAVIFNVAADLIVLVAQAGREEF